MNEWWSETPPSSTDQSGSTDQAALADFEIGALLGEGGSATVHVATHRAFGATVALKRWRTILTDDERRRFWTECRLQWQLSGHPNVVRLYWAEARAGQPPWMAMELFRESLAGRIEVGHRPECDETVRLADDILAGMAAIHRAGIVHRDVKPANVLINDGRAAIGDLGIAVVADSWTRDRAAGTLRYLAPELARGAEPSFRTDVYSTAVTILAAFDNRPPDWLDRLLIRASSFNADDRPADGAELLAQYQRAKAQGGPAVERPITRLPTPSMPNRRSAPGARWTIRRLARTPAAVFVLVAILIGGGIATGSAAHIPTAEIASEPAANVVGASTGSGDVTILLNDRLSIIDSANELAGSVALNGHYDQILRSPDGASAYLAGYGTSGGGGISAGPGIVTVVDSSSRKPVATIAAGSGLGSAVLAVNAAGDQIFVSCVACSELYQLDVPGSTVRGSVELRSVVESDISPWSSPAGMVTSADGAWVFVVGNSFADHRSTLFKIDTRDLTIAASVDLGFDGTPPLLSADGTRLWVAGKPTDPYAGDGLVASVMSVVDTATLEVTGRVEGDFGSAIVASPDGSSVSSVRPDPGVGYAFTVVDTESLASETFTSSAVVPSEDTIWTAPPRLIYAKNGERVFLLAADANGQGSVVAVDPATHGTAGVVPTVAFPTDGQLGGDGRYLYVWSSAGIGQVAVVDTAALDLVKVIGLG